MARFGYDEAKNSTWDFILQNKLASEDELHLVTDINGYNFETLNDVIYQRTGYHDIRQLYECENGSYYFCDIIEENIDSDYYDRG